MSLLIAAALALCPAGPRFHCVHDGDTFWNKGEKIRIADIDTPELHGQCPSETALAIRARDRLLQLLQQPFRIVRTGTDRYGRTLALVEVGGQDVGDILVSEGLAVRWQGHRARWCD